MVDFEDVDLRAINWASSSASYWSFHFLPEFELLFIKLEPWEYSEVVMCMSLPPYQFRTREVIGSASALGHGSACNASAGKTLWNGCKLGGGWPTASDLVNYTASLQIIENQKFITCMSLPSTSWYSPSSMPGISSCFLQEGQVGENALTNHLEIQLRWKQWPQGSRFTDPCEAMSSKHTGQASATPSICGASWSIASTFATRTLSSSDLRCWRSRMWCSRLKRREISIFKVRA